MKEFYYANVSGNAENTDEDGNRTGTYSITYSEPIKAYGNISADQGATSLNPFGIGENYQRVLQLADKDAPITETSILWIDDLDTSHPHDYEVRGVARSLESSRFALKKVVVSGDENG